jgi:hypothetical protein
MVEEIVCKYYNIKHKIGIDAQGIAWAQTDRGVVQCDKVVHMGSIHYRPKFTSRRISSKMLNNKSEIIYNFIIQTYCPF